MAIYTTQPNFSNLLQLGVRKLVGTNFKRRELEPPRYLNMTTSSKAFEFDQEVTLISTLTPKPENGAIDIIDPRVGRQKRYTHAAHAGGVRASWEAKMDELFGFVAKVFGALGDAARETINIEGAKPFNLADSGDTGFIPGFDTLALLHDAHTGPYGEALSYGDNRLSADLSETTIANALIQFEKIEDANGNKIAVSPQKLVIGPDAMFLVKEILQSQGKPFTADNTINVLRGILDVVILHYATDPDRWLIQGDGHDMQFLMRVAPVLDEYDDKATKSMVKTIATRFSYGHGEWRHVVGSPGI